MSVKFISIVIMSNDFMKDNDINGLRKAFFVTYQKMRSNKILEPVENQIAYVINAYPEYQRFLENIKSAEKVFSDYEENPFLKMALHLSIIEQVSTNRPPGIRDLYHGACQSNENIVVEKLMATVLQVYMHESLIGHQAPDEQQYLKSLQEKLHMLK